MACPYSNILMYNSYEYSGANYRRWEKFNSALISIKSIVGTFSEIEASHRCPISSEGSTLLEFYVIVSVEDSSVKPSSVLYNGYRLGKVVVLGAVLFEACDIRMDLVETELVT